MAETRSPTKIPAGDIQLVRYLMKAADGDTAYRDVYLQRAVEKLERSISRADYEQLKTQGATLEQLLQETRRAVSRQNWTRVQELSARVSTLRSGLEERQSDLQLAEAVYGAPEVTVDPFCSGLDLLLGRTAQANAARRDEAVAALSALEKADQDLASFYAARRGHVANITISTSEASASPSANNDDAGRLQQRAAEAAEKGNVDELQRIAQEMLKARPSAKSTGAVTDEMTAAERRIAYPPQLAERFPADVVERARRFGLAEVEMKFQLPGLPQIAQDALDRYGWRPSFPAAEVAREGELHLRPLLEQAKLPRETVEPLLEATMLFALHPFVNSSGIRYFPLFPDSEVALIEDFAEDAVPPEPSELLTALGLTRRTGLSRAEIEVRLARNGAKLLKEGLGADPIKFRLVCIPYDIYARAGQERGWGRQPRWTHVDGYQLLKGGRMRALVAGDVRFGGLFDLCSISQIDERENVPARFAVVHRERLMLR
jgi:hypothetical protein